MASLPKIQNGLVAVGPGQLALSQTLPLPKIQPNQVLVKVFAVALNPSDYKFLDYSTTVGAISGADFAGTVVQIGSDCLKPLAIGDKVCSCVFGANPSNPTNGAFSNYVAIRSELCIRVPTRISLENAASMPVALITSVYVLRSLRLPVLELSSTALPKGRPSNKITMKGGLGPTKGKYVLVNGGATATGTIVIQILNMVGCQPITTCSAHNFDLLMKRGAKKCFDYRSPTCAKEIRAYTDDKLEYALDCIGTGITMDLCYQAISSTLGGRYTALEPYSERVKATRSDVIADWILAWTVYGEPVALEGLYQRPPILADFIMCSRWIEAVELLLVQGKIKPHPVQIERSGMESVISGIDLMRKEKVSGKKLVYVI